MIEIGGYINLHEAAINYSCMHLNLDKKYDFRILVNSDAMGDRDAPNEYFSVPLAMMMRKYLASKMTNLNEPCKIEDTSWIKPVKYVVCWEMLLEKSSWSYTNRYCWSSCFLAKNQKLLMERQLQMLKIYWFTAAKWFWWCLVEGGMRDGKTGLVILKIILTL
jgi:hypothetical protein